MSLKGAFSDAVLHTPAIGRLDPRDRRFVTEVVYGTLRWQLALDGLLAGTVARPLGKVDPAIRVLLRMSVYQMWRMDRVPDHAVVDDAVELAKRSSDASGAAFVNGILRSLARVRPWRDRNALERCEPWIGVSLPEWLWKRWSERFGVETAREYAVSLNDPPEVAFRGRGGGCEWVPPGARKSDIVPGAWILGEEAGPLLEDRGASLRIQDEASQLVPFLPDRLEGLRVWDVCAAPGGKTSLLAERAGAAGLVVTTDLSQVRARRLARTLGALGLSRVPVVVADAAREAPFRLQFDLVVADVPCSGLGTLRRNPEIKWRMRPSRLAGFGRRQLEILSSVSTSIRPSGLLLYSTCSTEPEENDDVVDAFLQGRSGFRLVRPIKPPGIEAWLDDRRFVRTYPSTRGWDGFFAALMIRES